MKQATETDGGQSVEYRIGDFDDPMSDFLIIHYRGVVSLLTVVLLIRELMMRSEHGYKKEI